MDPMPFPALICEIAQLASLHATLVSPPQTSMQLFDSRLIWNFISSEDACCADAMQSQTRSATVAVIADRTAAATAA